MSIQAGDFFKWLKIFQVPTGGGPPPSGALLAVNNLSDVLSAPASLTNLGAVAKAGSTMTGALILYTSSPSSALEAASKGYVDAQVGSSVTLTGDVTGTGTGTVPTTISNSAVTLAKMANLPAGSLLGNPAGVSATPSAISFSIFLQAGQNLSDVGNPSLSLSNINGVSRAGSTMTGLLVLSGDPVVALGAATKQYVDNKSTQFPLIVLTAGTYTLAVNTRYIVDSTAGQVILNLPSAFVVGDEIKIYGTGNIITGAGWVIVCGAGQVITGGPSSTSSGGTLSTNFPPDCVELLGIVANTRMKTVNVNSITLITS